MTVFFGSALAFGKIILTFGCMLALLRVKFPLWIAILAGCLILAFLTGLPLSQLAGIPPQTATDTGFLILIFMLFGILALSGVQSASGQSRRLVRSMEALIPWPRVRLLIFPAMVGLLPMPGGALFSCPMLEESAHGLNLDPRRKALINYWFRHIWELAWPLYPGYVLASSFLGLGLSGLLVYTFPLVAVALTVGWFFLLRDIQPPVDAQVRGRREVRAALRSCLYESLPIWVTLLGAAAAGQALSLLAPTVPSQAAFLISVSLGIVTALWQGRGQLQKSLAQIACTKGNLNLVLLIYAIFVFKDVINASGVVAGMGAVGENTALLILVSAVLAFFCGALTGIMVGYVGASFPIILGIVAQNGLEAYTAPLIVLALAAGNAGMLVSPLHVCLIVTLDFFKTTYLAICRSLVSAAATLMACGALWAAVLYFFGARFF